MVMTRRLNMGLLQNEVFDLTTRNEERDIGYCKLQLPAPVLQWELATEQKPVKYYFGIQLTLFEDPDIKDKDTNYFLCFGDQIDTVVFICAIYISGDSIPCRLVFIDDTDFKLWLFPKEGDESQVPTHRAWGLHDPVEFCRHNMYDGHNVTMHASESATLSEKIVIVITHLANAKKDPQYSFIFNFEFHDICSSSETPSDDECLGDNAKLTPAQKGALTKALNKQRGKERDVPTRGANKVNVLALLANAHQRAADEAANKKNRKGSRKTGQGKGKGAIGNGNGKGNGKGDGKGNEKGNGNEKEKVKVKEKETQDIGQDKGKGKRKDKEKEKLEEQIERSQAESAQISSLTAIAGEIVMALTSAAGTKTVSSSSTEHANALSKRTQLVDDEDAFELYHRKRMKDLTFMDSMTKVYSNMASITQQPQNAPTTHVQQTYAYQQQAQQIYQGGQSSTQQQAPYLQQPSFTQPSPNLHQQSQFQQQFQQQMFTPPFQKVQQSHQLQSQFQQQFQQQMPTTGAPFQQMQQTQQYSLPLQQQMPTTGTPTFQQVQHPQQFQTQLQQQMHTPSYAEQMQQPQQTQSLLQQQMSTTNTPFQQVQQPQQPQQLQSQLQQQMPTSSIPFTTDTTDSAILNTTITTSASADAADSSASPAVNPADIVSCFLSASGNPTTTISANCANDAVRGPAS